MSYNLGTEDSPILVFVNHSGGVLDASLRCKDRAAFDAAAKHAGLLYEVTETAVDEEGVSTTVGTGEFALSKGVDIDHIGPVVLTPATHDSEGVVVTPAVLDNRHHVNFRLTESALTGVDQYGVLNWHKWSMAWTVGGTLDTEPNKSEVAVSLYEVSLIDPATITSIARRWL